MLLCTENQSPDQLMNIIEKISIDKGYKVKRATSLVNNDTLIVNIKFTGFPISRMVISENIDKKGVSIINIVPSTESGVYHIEQETYNSLLDVFKDDVFQSISDKYGNLIESNKEDYTIQELIPKSFEKLNIWLNNYPLSAHQFDTNRWYDFVISLHKNGETLYSEDLGKYIKEEYGWKDDDIDRIELRLESHLDLLEYYDNNR